MEFREELNGMWFFFCLSVFIKQHEYYFVSFISLGSANISRTLSQGAPGLGLTGIVDIKSGNPFWYKTSKRNQIFGVSHLQICMQTPG